MYPLHLFVDSANEAYVRISDHFKQIKPSCSPRGQLIKEFSPASITIKYPYLNFVYDSRREINYGYLIAEFIWYLSGETDKDFISFYAPFWNSIADSDGHLNSNYGYYIFHQLINNFKNRGITQFNWIIDNLINDPDSRQAIININSIWHKYETKDFPCTTSIQFLIRENKLNCIVHMRSTDFIKGFCNDIYQFTQIQKIVLNTLKLNKDFCNLKLGKFTLFSNSFHLYERDFWRVEKEKKDDDYKNIPEPLQINSMMDNVGITINDTDYLIEQERNLRLKQNNYEHYFIAPEAGRLIDVLKNSSYFKE